MAPFLIPRSIPLPAAIFRIPGLYPTLPLATRVHRLPANSRLAHRVSLSRIFGPQSYFQDSKFHHNMQKMVSGPDEAIHDITDDAIIMLGGFGLCGIPENCIAALARKGVRNLTCISNNAGVDDFGLGLLLKTRQIRRMISSYVGENEEFERQLLSGELDVELNPQGTLATRIQMAAMGIPAFFTPAGYGTEIALGKEIREFGGKPYLMEHALHADFAIVKAWKGDSFGNLVFRRTTRNFSTSMAKAGTVTIAEVEELVRPGDIDPDQVHVPGIYVHRIFQGSHYEKRIERRTTTTNK
jgi:3-oxoacid CoA-transferase subunit A